MLWWTRKIKDKETDGCDEWINPNTGRHYNKEQKEDYEKGLLKFQLIVFAIIGLALLANYIFKW
jgi:hypothetical protein